MATAAPSPLEELLARLRAHGMPAGGADALAFTLPGSGEGAPRITAAPARAGRPPAPVPPALMKAIETHVLSCNPCLYLEGATEADLAGFSTSVVYPANHPAVILYIYPLSEGKSPEYEYTSPAGLSARDIARCIAATYRVIYAAECAAVGEAAHAARAGGICINRGRTNGPFGIWGHDLRDLVLEGFTWARAADGSGGALLPLIGS